MRQLIRVHPDERIDLPDFEQVGGLLELFDIMRTNKTVLLPEGRNVGAASIPTDTRIFTGFDIYDVVGAAGTCKLRRGAGIFKLLEEGTLTHGILIGDVGAEFASLDLSGESDDTYSVFVRATYADSDQENRVHWNVGGSPAEYVDFVNTRRTLTWEYTYQSSSAAHPAGGDWVEVWRITVVSNQITANADYRMLFFEGDAISGAGQWAEEWGDGANDRNAARGTYGITDLHQWVQAVRRQLADILLDTGGWYQAAQIAMAHLESEHYGYPTTGDSGKHKTVTFGDNVTPDFHQLATLGPDEWRLRSLNNPDLPELRGKADDGAATSEIVWTPRGAGNPLTTGDLAALKVGDDTNPDWTQQIVKNAANDYTIQDAAHATVFREVAGGSAVSGGQVIDYYGMLRSNEGFRIRVPKATDILMVPLQMLNDQSASIWSFDTGAAAENNASRLTVTGNASALTSLELVMPHMSIISAIRVLWAQDVTSGGNEMRLYAQKHRVAQTTVGQVGGGTGNPSTFVNLKTVNNYIEQGLAGGSPHRYVAEFTCDEATANRTFDMTQDKLLITLVAAAAGGPVNSVYWIMVKYTLDYVTPPLV